MVWKRLTLFRIALIEKTRHDLLYMAIGYNMKLRSDCIDDTILK